MSEVYNFCTEFLINSANLFDITYIDANCILFFILFPATTAILGAVVTVQQIRINLLRAQRRGSRAQ